MMGFLSEWMRGLILVIFLAVVLDMILPNNAMQRYVKLVMGLLIILLMLSPLLKLYGANVYEMDFTLDKLLSKEGMSNLKSIDEITAQGEQLQAQQANSTVEQWKALVAENVTVLIEQSHEVNVDGVQLHVTEDANGRPAGIEYLAVIVMPKGEPGVVKPIAEVEPIIIGGSQQNAQPQVSEGVKNETTEAILSQLSTELQLPAAKISVIWEEAQGR